VNPSCAHAAVVVDELVRCGVTDAVLCPGSRNAPLAFALHAADTAGRLRLHVRIDERTAGFLALGLARRSGRPVPVATTSGTAVANLHPAVLEASHAGVALLVLTADRPPSLIGTGANQTIAQPGIFGAAVRLGVHAGVARDAATEHGLWRSQVCRAVAAATGVRPGPVHLNLPFAEPLVPDGTAAPPGRPDGSPWTRVCAGTRTAPPLPLDPAARTLVIAGDGAPADVSSWGAPLVAEPSSTPWVGGAAGVVRTGPWLLATPAVTTPGIAPARVAPFAGRVSADSPVPDGSLRPAQVVVVGRPTLHRAVHRLLAAPDVAVYAADGPAPWTDVAGAVRAVGSVPPLCPPAEWTQRWAAADAIAARALDAALDEPGAPGGLRLARALVAALPDGALLTLGSSNPVRDVSLAAVPRPGLTVLANRGVAGIDGTVSSAAGAALAHDGPGYALLGDLTLLHDTTGLVIGPDEPRPDLTIVVLNDGGGGIFGLLEQGAPEYAASFERVFGTPHTVDLAALCAAVGVGHVGLDDLAELAAALAPAPGLRLVEVRADRATLRAGHAALRAAVVAAIG
jgi:2-succinyl-5-enolpyruvyl-6-hydroxy-3-cyclohexene-1-carboxylate synthase